MISSEAGVIALEILSTSALLSDLVLAKDAEAVGLVLKQAEFFPQICGQINEYLNLKEPWFTLGKTQLLEVRSKSENSFEFSLISSPTRD